MARSTKSANQARADLAKAAGELAAVKARTNTARRALDAAAYEVVVRQGRRVQITDAAALTGLSRQAIYDAAKREHRRLFPTLPFEV